MKYPFQLALLFILFMAPGLSPFNYEWRQAAKQPTPAHNVTGRWEGRWISGATGHKDKLRALITPVDTNHYDVKFHAAYRSETFKFRAVYFGYTVRMETQPSTNNGVLFRGSENLGRLAGGV